MYCKQPNKTSILMRCTQWYTCTPDKSSGDFNALIDWFEASLCMCAWMNTGKRRECCTKRSHYYPWKYDCVCEMLPFKNKSNQKVHSAKNTQKRMANGQTVDWHEPHSRSKISMSETLYCCMPDNHPPPARYQSIKLYTNYERIIMMMQWMSRIIIKQTCIQNATNVGQAYWNKVILQWNYTLYAHCRSHTHTRSQFQL